jgi:hypothetical protein
MHQHFSALLAQDEVLGQQRDAGAAVQTTEKIL